MSERRYIIKIKEGLSQDLVDKSIHREPVYRTSKDRTKIVLAFEDFSAIENEDVFTHSEILEELKKDEWGIPE